METQSLIPSGEIKKEPCSETTARAVRNFPFLREYIKQELADGQTVKKEANEEEESDMSPVKKDSNKEDESDCEKCQLKYEGGCPEHGTEIYIDNAEEGQSQGYSQDSSPLVQIDDNKDRQVLGRVKFEQSKVCEAHIDDVGISPNGGCSTESDEMFSVCEMNNELCVAGNNCGAQSSVKIKTGQTIHNTGKPFSCDVCGVGFDYCSLLKVHKITHTGEKPYKCDDCGLDFTLHSDLKYHKRTHAGEKPYKCDVCGLGFAQQGRLKTHKRTHTKEELYKCDVCGLGFTQQSHLKMHRRTHTVDTPYKCDVCSFGFTRQWHLMVHQRTHTGEKPYKCDMCGLGFAMQGNLKKHKRKHTG